MITVLIKEKIKKYGLIGLSLRLFYRTLRWFLYIRFNISYKLVRLIKGCVVKEVNGFKFFLDLKNDAGISKDLFIYGKREHLSTDYLLNSKIISDGDTVLDIGANIGYYALIESKLVGTKGTVYAIEPVLKNFQTLNKNISINNISNIETYNLGAGNKDEESYINVGKKGNWSSFINQGDHHYSSRQKVSVVKIDSFLEDKTKPSFARMDVEGYEYAIIEGMKETLKNKITLLIEFHPTILLPKQMESMFKIFKDNNFSKAKIILDPPLRSLNRKGNPRKIIGFLDRKLDGVKKTNEIKEVTLDELHKMLLSRNRHLHAIVYK